MLQPARHPIGRQWSQLDRGGRADQLGVRLLTSGKDEHQQRTRIGSSEVAGHLVAQLRLALTKLLHAPHDDGAPLRQHRRGVYQRVELLRREVGGEAGIEVEVAVGVSPDGGVDEQAKSLVLEDVFVTIEEIDGIEGAPSALFEAAQERVERERRHTGRKLPPPCAGRKVERLLTAWSCGLEVDCGRLHERGAVRVWIPTHHARARILK